MYEKAENQINKGVLLLVPKRITVGEGIPIPDDITGVFPWYHQWGNPQNNKIKSTNHSSYMHANSANKSGTIWYMYEQPLHFKPKTKQL